MGRGLGLLLSSAMPGFDQSFHTDEVAGRKHVGGTARAGPQWPEKEQLGFPLVPFLTLLVGEGSLLKWATAKSWYPYSNLSTGRPRQSQRAGAFGGFPCRGPLLLAGPWLQDVHRDHHQPGSRGQPPGPPSWDRFPQSLLRSDLWMVKWRAKGGKNKTPGSIQGQPENGWGNGDISRAVCGMGELRKELGTGLLRWHPSVDLGHPCVGRPNPELGPKRRVFEVPTGPTG